MALMIAQGCIACDACVWECPSLAILPGEPSYVINPELCTECVGVYDGPQCAMVCPVKCILLDPDHQETDVELLVKYHRLNPN